MKKILIVFVLVLFAGVITSYAQDTVSAANSKDFIGKTVFVKGKVADVFTSKSGNIFIQFDDKNPNQTFTAAILNGVQLDLTNIKPGCTLTVFGEIKEYKDKPEIILEKQEQIIKVE